MNLAFIISCNNYNDPAISNLKYADNDASLFKNAMLDYCGLSESEIVQLATISNRNSIINSINLKKREMIHHKVNNLFLHFSGHGFHSIIDDDDYLVPLDASAECLEETSISFELLCKLLKSFKAQNIIIFIDACKSLIHSKNLNVENSFRFDRHYFNGIAAFFSCCENQNSYEVDDIQSSIFTKCLCDALSTRGRCRTVNEIDTYLKAEVPNLCYIYNKPIQNPHTIVNQLHMIDIRIVASTDLRLFKEIKHEVSNLITEDIGGVKDNRILSIDFGTTKTIMSYSSDDTNIYILSSSGSIYIPSVICFDCNYNYCIGDEANYRQYDKSYKSVSNFKRDLGTGKKHLIFDIELSVETITVLFIKALLYRAEQYLGIKVNECLISNPGNFSMNQCNALETVMIQAGLKLKRSIGEPCCAGLNYPYIQNEDGDFVFLVIDLGGGTLDISIMYAGDGVLETAFVVGDNEIGGADYDIMVYDYIMSCITELYPDVIINRNLKARVMQEAEASKIALTNREKVTIKVSDLELVNGNLHDFIVDLDRDTFLLITNDLNEKFKKSLDKAKKYIDNNVSKNIFEFKHIILGGLGAKIYAITTILMETFPGITIMDQFCENAVIKGLGRYARVLDGFERKTLLLDCLYYGLKIIYNNDSSQDLIYLDSIVPNKKSVLLEKREGVLVAYYNSGYSESLYNIDSNNDELVIGIDANRTILLCVKNDELMTITQIQINNCYRIEPFDNYWYTDIEKYKALGYKTISKVSNMFDEYKSSTFNFK